jgi:hypothetical protein
MEPSDAKAEASSAVEDTTTTTIQDDDDTNVPTNCSANRRCFLCKARACSKSSTELMMKAAAAEGQDRDRRRGPVNLSIDVGLKYVCDVLELDDVIPTTTSSAAANPTAFCFFCSGVMLDILKDLSEMEALRKKLDVRMTILKTRVETANNKKESTVQESFGDDNKDIDIADVHSGGEEIGKE